MSPRSYVIWLLGRKDYSRKQLEEKLRKRDSTPSEISQLLSSLTAEGWYQESAFKKVRVRQLLKRGFGPSAVKAKLRNDKILISNEEVDAAYQDLDTTSEKQINELIIKLKKRYSNKPLVKHELVSKIGTALVRKGFSASICFAAVKKHLTEN